MLSTLTGRDVGKWGMGREYFWARGAAHSQRYRGTHNLKGLREGMCSQVSRGCVYVGRGRQVSEWSTCRMITRDRLTFSAVVGFEPNVIDKAV